MGDTGPYVVYDCLTAAVLHSYGQVRLHGGILCILIILSFTEDVISGILGHFLLIWEVILVILALHELALIPLSESVKVTMLSTPKRI